MPRWFNSFDFDHLGSTLAISCHKQTSVCADRAVYRYYRYGAYGRMKVYNAGGTLLASDDSPIERMYTGQVWDAAAQMYYYNARFYDPKAARFLTMDPAREFMSPYAYVLWNPIGATDPTGMLTVPEGGAVAGIAWVERTAISGGYSASLKENLALGLVSELSPIDTSRLLNAPDLMLEVELMHVLAKSGTALEAIHFISTFQSTGPRAQLVPTPGHSNTPSPMKTAPSTPHASTVGLPNSPTPGPLTSRPSLTSTSIPETLGTAHSPTPAWGYTSTTPPMQTTPVDVSAAFDLVGRAFAIGVAGEMLETSGIMFHTGALMLAVPEPTLATKVAAGLAITGGAITGTAAVGMIYYGATGVNPLEP